MSADLRSPLVDDVEGGRTTCHSSARPAKRVSSRMVALFIAGSIGVAALVCVAYSSSTMDFAPSTSTSAVATSTGITAVDIVDEIEGPDAVFAGMFKDWMTTHNKVYSTLEEAQRRFKVFLDNVEHIKSLNAESDGEAFYDLNRFSDLSAAEFRSIYLSDMVANGKQQHAETPRAPSTRYMAAHEVPDSMDWREKGAVSPVRDQQACGSCWAFSAVQELESKWFLKHNELNTLSVQQILECDPHDPACYGGWPMHAYQYIQEAGGLEAEEDYPYVVNNHVICLANQTWNTTDVLFDDPPLTNYCDQTCKKPSKFAASIKSFEAVSDNEDEIAAYVAANGPVSVGMDAGFLQFYRRGISDTWFCSQHKINHAVLLVGFGEEKGKKFWIVKNSWGPKWGEDGYFRIVRGKNKCGIASLVSAVEAGDK